MKSPDYEPPSPQLELLKLKNMPGKGLVRKVVISAYRYHLLELGFEFPPDSISIIIIPPAIPFPIPLYLATNLKEDDLKIYSTNPQDCNFSFSSREPQYGKPQEKVVVVHFKKDQGGFSNLLIRAENSITTLGIIDIDAIPSLNFYNFKGIKVYGQFENDLKSPSRLLPPLVFLDEEENKVGPPKEKVKPSEIFVFAGFYGRTKGGILTSGFVVGKKLKE